MNWEWQRNYVTLSTGERIRYSFFCKPESNIYFVRFKDKDGGYARISTGQMKKPQAIEAAHRIILDNYQQITPTSETTTWEVAREKLKSALVADNKRPKTIRGYREALDRLIDVFPRMLKVPVMSRTAWRVISKRNMPAVLSPANRLRRASRSPSTRGPRNRSIHASAP